MNTDVYNTLDDILTEAQSLNDGLHAILNIIDPGSDAYPLLSWAVEKSSHVATELDELLTHANPVTEVPEADSRTTAAAIPADPSPVPSAGSTPSAK